MANEKKAVNNVPPKKVEQPKPSGQPTGVKQPQVNPYDVPCINLKLSVRQLNELRSALLCKIASLQIKLESSFIPQEIEMSKSTIAQLTNIARDLNNVLNQAMQQLAKPTVQSSIDNIKKAN